MSSGKYNLGSESGMSLVSVMMAVALSGLVITALGQFFMSMMQAQSRAQIDGDVRQVMDDVQRGLISGKACLETLATAGQPLGAPLVLPATLTSVVDENSTSILSLGSTATSHLNVKSLTLKLNKINPTLQPNHLLVADLEVVMEHARPGRWSRDWGRSVSLTLETGPSGEIVGCNSLNLTERQNFEIAFCRSVGGTVNSGGLCNFQQSASLTQAVCSSLGFQAANGHCR